jgi:hypothetical protein
VDDQMLTDLPLDVRSPLELGFRLWREGALGEARAQMEHALEQATLCGSLTGQLSALHLLGNLAFDRGELAECRALHEAVLAECRARRIGVGVASSLHNLGLLAAREGDGERARALIVEAINLYYLMGRASALAAARANLRRVIAADGPRL